MRATLSLSPASRSSCSLTVRQFPRGPPREQMVSASATGSPAKGAPALKIPPNADPVYEFEVVTVGR